MRVLLLEECPTVESAVACQLGAAGYELWRCADDLGDGPCRAVHSGDACPLGRRVDVAVVVREHGAPHLLFEMGAVCAERQRVPVVRVGGSDADVSEVAGAAAGLDRLWASYAAAVRTARGADADWFVEDGEDMFAAGAYAVSQHNPRPDDRARREWDVVMTDARVVDWTA